MNERSEDFVDEVMHKPEIREEIETYTGINNLPSSAYNALENLARNTEMTSVDKSWIRIYQVNNIVNESEDGYYISTDYLKDPIESNPEKLPYQI